MAAAIGSFGVSGAGEGVAAAAGGSGGLKGGHLVVEAPAPAPPHAAAGGAGSRGERAAAEGGATGFESCKTVASASAYVLDLIHSDAITPARAAMMMRETLEEWSEHVNPAFLTYRKSVADDFAACEWRDGKPGGCTLIDSEGHEYIDCLGGFGIFNCGRSHPVVVGAVAAQLAKQPLHSQELLDPLRAYAAALLARTLPGELQYAFFTNSGTESVEACLKFAMMTTGRRHFIGVVGAFHGKTLGALAGTSKAVFRKPFAGALLPFTHVPVNDVTALRQAFESARFTGNEVAGFIVEPILGEGGIHVCTDEYLRAARALCDEAGACLIFDEVQSGMGRSGKWWACQHAGVAPDLMAIGKAFGGGVQPVGAAVGTAKTWAKYIENCFLATTTFGGNPCAMAAAIAAMHVVETEGLAARAALLGDRLLAGLRSLAATYPHLLAEVRGRGLMIGLQFHDNDTGYDFSRRCFAARVLMAGTLINSRVLRCEPPLTLTDAEADTILARYAAVLADMHVAGAGARALLTPATAAAADAAAAATAAAAAAAAASADATIDLRGRAASDDGELPTATVLGGTAAGAPGGSSGAPVSHHNAAGDASSDASSLSASSDDEHEPSH